MWHSCIICSDPIKTMSIIMGVEKGRIRDWAPTPRVPREYQKSAEQAVEETANIPDFAYFGDLPLGETWAFTFSRNRDSSLLEISNYETIKKDLENRFPRDVQEEHVSHWAVGWVDHLAVRMLGKNGKVTKAGIAALKWKKALEDYPAADDDDLSRREHEATLENIKYEGGLDEEIAGEVFSWLWDNNPEALEPPQEGQGGYPSQAQIEEALWGIDKPTEDMLEERREEEEALAEEEEWERMTPEEREAKRRREYVDPPEQLRFWRDIP